MEVYLILGGTFILLEFTLQDRLRYLRKIAQVTIHALILKIEQLICLPGYLSNMPLQILILEELRIRLLKQLQAVDIELLLILRLKVEKRRALGNKLVEYLRGILLLLLLLFIALVASVLGLLLRSKKVLV